MCVYSARTLILYHAFRVFQIKDANSFASFRGGGLFEGGEGMSGRRFELEGCVAQFIPPGRTWTPSRNLWPGGRRGRGRLAGNAVRGPGCSHDGGWPQGRTGRVGLRPGQTCRGGLRRIPRVREGRRLLPCGCGISGLRKDSARDRGGSRIDGNVSNAS